MADDYSRFRRVPAGADYSQFQRVDDASDQSAAETARLARVGSPPLLPVQASPEDIEKYSPATGMSPLEKLAVGAGAATDRAYRGVRGLLPPGLLPQDLSGGTGAEDAALYQKYHPGGYATAGEIGADVAMSAIPVGAVNRAVQGAQRVGTVAKVLPQALARYAPAAADITTNAGYAAATSPENRDKAAAFGAAGTAAGKVLTRALGGMVKPSEHAQELMSTYGVRLTPGQAGSGIAGAAADTYERGLTAIPGLGQITQNKRLEALRDWQKYLDEVASEAQELALKAARSKAGPISRSSLAQPGGALMPNEAMTVAAKTATPGDTALMDVARAGQPIFKGTTQTDMDKLTNIGRAAVVGAAGHSVGPITIPFALLSMVGHTDTGRRFILGQIGWQQFMKEDPALAALVLREAFPQLGRAGAMQAVPQEEGR